MRFSDLLPPTAYSFAVTFALLRSTHFKRCAGRSPRPPSPRPPVSPSPRLPSFPRPGPNTSGTKRRTCAVSQLMQVRQPVLNPSWLNLPRPKRPVGNQWAGRFGGMVPGWRANGILQLRVQMKPARLFIRNWKSLGPVLTRSG